jgi:hypothetical protein
MNHIQEKLPRLRFIYGLMLCALLLIFAQPQVALAQWSTPDTSGNINSTNTGNVGIGTSSPGARLHVGSAGDSATNYTVEFANSGNVAGAGGILFSQGSNYAYKWYTASTGGSGGQLILSYINKSTGAYVNNNIIGVQSGNFGIGTAFPSTRLHVSGDNSSSYPIIKLENTQTNGHSWWLYSGAFGTPGALGIYDETAGSYRVFFDPAGNVGMGTISPSQKLDVNGSIRTRDGNLFLQRDLTDQAGRRNWSFSTEQYAVGDFVINESTANNTIPSVPRLSILSGGKVGIGITAPNFKLDVGGIINATDIYKNGVPFTGNSQWATGTNSINYSSGNVGIGTVNPGGKLQVGDGTGSIALRVADSTGVIAVGSQAGVMRMQTDGTNIRFLSTSDGFAPVQAGVGKFEGAGNSYFIGSVGIGTTNPSPTAKLDVNGDTKVTGNINATGNITGGTINATYQDVAEWVPATHALPAGTVVVLNPAKSNEVMASTKSYDTRVAGVVSERPGLALGEAGKDKALVATTGRVKVMVDATRAPIHVGDLLVTSDQEGQAMKSEPLNLGGAQIHRPGTLIGKALEPLESGKGKILVLLSLQ